MIPKRIEIGDVLHGYPASTHNWLIDHVQRLLAGGDGQAGTSPLSPAAPHVLVDVYNASGAELPQHGVVSLSKPEIDPSDEDSAQQAELLFRGVDADPDLPFGVLRFPIPDDGVGERAVVVSGPALVRLNLSDTSHTQADVDTDDNDKLHSGTTGRATIWWYEKQGDGGTETGEQWAIVMLGGGGDGEDGADGEEFLPILAKVTESGGIGAATLNGTAITPASGQITLYTRPGTPGDDWAVGTTATGYNLGGDPFEENTLVEVDSEHYIIGEFCTFPS